VPSHRNPKTTGAASAPPGAGAFTANPDLMWDELVTNALKLPTLTPHNAGGAN